MARMFKPKYSKRRTVKDRSGRTVMVTKRATRGPNKGRLVEVAKREPILGSDGKPVYAEARNWAIQYTDADGRVRTTAGYADSAATRQKLAEIERSVARQRAGILDVAYEHGDKPAADHIADWLADLVRADRSPEYIRKVCHRVPRLSRELGWRRLSAALGGSS